MKRSLIYAVVGAGITAVLAITLLSTPLGLNNPPEITVASTKQVVAGTNIVLSADKVIDRDDDPLTYNWTQLSGQQVLLFDSNTSNPTFSIQPGLTNKTLSFQLTVSDGKATKSSIVNVVVLANKPPVANAGLDQTVSKGNQIVLDGSLSSDPENSTLAYKWAQAAGPEVELSDISIARPTFIAPSSTIDKVLTFQLIVNDGMADSKPATVKITVKANRAPVANAGPAQTYKAGETVTLNGLGSYDPEKDSLVYKWTQTGGPDVKLSDPKAARPTFIAPSSTIDKVLTFQLIVNDGTADSIPVTVKITVKANRAPVANAGRDQSVTQGNTVTLDGSGSSDPDNGKITYKWKQTSGQNVTLSDPKIAKPTFKAPAADDSNKILTFQLIVNDGAEDSKPDTMQVTVQADKPPVADAGLDRDIAGGSQVALNGSKSYDPGGKKLTYEWKQISGPSVTLSDPKIAKPTFKAPATTTADKVLEFQLVVNNGVSDSKPDTVKITVKANRAPVANAGPDKATVEDNDVVLDGSKSSDPDGDNLTYQWKQISGTRVTLKYSQGAQAVFTAPNVTKATVLSFQLAVSDGKLSKTDTVLITVRPR